MDADRWRRIEALYLEALDHDPESRARHVEEAAAGDVELRDEVLSLLAQHEADPDFLGEPIVRVADLAEGARATPEEGRTIGPYRLVRVLGRGGMGEVHLARQETDEFELFVALKVIRRGMATEDVLERFRLERRILARLRHPNIAQLLDGGATEDGRPYFAMEFVDGKRLDAYCDEMRLPIRARLKLFRQVCDAVQHAHSNLILHRDLKPGNILVTPDGTPKLLDFGIGKLLDPDDRSADTPATRTGMRVLTPEYASPEQVMGDPITVASDIYQLGVVLYELLTGVRPYSGASTGEIERAVMGDEPARPSTVLAARTGDSSETDTSPDEIGRLRQTDPSRLRRTLSGDLDNIVLKALRKEPERRYTSAMALADDIGRYLEGRPVRARADTFGYVAGKFIRRNVWPLTAAATVFVALAASSFYTQAQSRRVIHERDKARAVESFLLESFGAANANEPGDSVTARALLDRQAESLETTLADEPELRGQMYAVLADAYDRLGLLSEAETMARTSLQIRREALGEEHPDVAASLSVLGWIRHQAGDSDEGETLLRESIPIWRAAGSEPVGLSRALNDLGVVMESKGEFDEAEALYTEALLIRRSEFGSAHLRVAITGSNLSVIKYRRGDYDGAAAAARDALESMRAVVGPDHNRSITIQSNLAAIQMAAGDVAGAAEEYRDLAARQAALQGPDHPLTLGVKNALGSALLRLERWDEAEAVIRETLAALERVVGPEHRAVGQGLLGLGRTLSAQGRHAEALEAQERGLTIYRSSYGPDNYRVGDALAALSETHERMGERAEAERLLREAVAIYDAALGPDHRLAGEARSRLARRALATERFGEALELFRQYERVLDQNDDVDDPDRVRNRLFIAQTLIAMGDLAAADSVLALTAVQLGEEDPANATIGDAVALERLQAFQDTLRVLLETRRDRE